MAGIQGIVEIVVDLAPCFQLLAPSRTIVEAHGARLVVLCVELFPFVGFLSPIGRGCAAEDLLIVFSFLVEITYLRTS